MLLSKLEFTKFGMCTFVLDQAVLVFLSALNGHIELIGARMDAIRRKDQKDVDCTRRVFSVARLDLLLLWKMFRVTGRLLSKLRYAYKWVEICVT